LPPQNPFREFAPQQANPYAPPAANPFSDRPMPGYFPMAYDPAAIRRFAKAKVQGPAILLMVTGFLLVLSAVGSVFLAGAIYMEDPSESETLVVGIIFGVMAVICIVAAAVMIYAANRMRKLQSYGLAMTATVLTLVVGFLICIPAALAGIWPLVVLLDSQVKLGFSLPPTPDEV